MIKRYFSINFFLLFVLFGLFCTTQCDVVIIDSSMQSILLFFSKKGEVWKILWEKSNDYNYVKTRLAQFDLVVKKIDQIRHSGTNHVIAYVDYVLGRAIYKKIEDLEKSHNNTYNIADIAWVPLDSIKNGFPTKKNRSGAEVPLQLGRESLDILKNLSLDTSNNTAKKAFDRSSQSIVIDDGYYTKWPNKNSDLAVLFYDKDQLYGEFANTYDVAITMDGKEYKSLEHYFQAQKAPYIQGLNQTSEQFYDNTLKKIGLGALQNNMQLYKNRLNQQLWQKVSLQVMFKALQEKFSGKYSVNVPMGNNKFENKNLKDRLLETWPKIIVENAGKNDNFYGAGGDYKGVNHLGKMLMQVRDDIRAGKNSQIYNNNYSIQYWKQKLAQDYKNYKTSGFENNPNSKKDIFGSIKNFARSLDALIK